MKKILIASAIIFATISPSYAGHHFGPRVGHPVGRQFDRHYGRNLGIGAGLLGLGIVGAIILNSQRPPVECLIGYDRFGRPVYDQECFE